MEKSLLIHLVKKFSAKEMKDFGEYVQSPFFNKNQSVINLYHYLKKPHPDFDKRKLEKMYVYRRILPNVKYSDGFMRSITFHLTRLAEEYLSYLNYKTDRYSYHKHLISELNKKGADRLFHKRLEEAVKIFDRCPKRNELDYLNRFIMEFERDSFYEKHMSVIPDYDFLAESQYLIKFFLFRICKSYGLLINKKLVVNIDFKLEFLEEVLKYVSEHTFDEPEINLYRDLLEFLINDGDMKRYVKLRSSIDENFDKLNQDTISNSYIGMQNFLIRRRQKGEPGMTEELFDLYKDMISKKALSCSASGYISHTHFWNIVCTGLIIKEFDWTRRFIDEYRGSLEPEKRDDAVNFCYARLYYALGDYEKALEMVSKVPYEDIFYKIEIKNLSIRINYELGYYDAVEDTIGSFRKILKNKLITDLLVKASSNFMRFAAKLTRVAAGAGKKSELEELRTQIEGTECLVGRDWLIKKISELQRKS